MESPHSRGIILRSDAGAAGMVFPRNLQGSTSPLLAPRTRETRTREKWAPTVKLCAKDSRRRTPSARCPQLCSGGEVLADAFDGVALAIVQREEFEAVAQPLAIADDGADFDGIGRER